MASNVSVGALVRDPVKCIKNMDFGVRLVHGWLWLHFFFNSIQPRFTQVYVEDNDIYVIVMGTEGVNRGQVSGK